MFLVVGVGKREGGRAPPASRARALQKKENDKNDDAQTKTKKTKPNNPPPKNNRIHVGPFAEGFHKHVPVSRLLQGPAPSPAPLWCKDQNPLCEGWAEEGECLANPTWMVGSREHPGQCIRACGRCDVAAHLHVGEKQPPAWCEDSAPKCEAWAEQGECDANKVWMVGTRAKPGHCLRSCNACHVVAHLYKDKVAEEEKRAAEEDAGRRRGDDGV